MYTTTTEPLVYPRVDEYDQVQRSVRPDTVRFLMELAAIQPLAYSPQPAILGEPSAALRVPALEVSFLPSALNYALFSKQDREAVRFLTQSERDLLYHGWLHQGYAPAVSLHHPLMPAQENVY